MSIRLNRHSWGAGRRPRLGEKHSGGVGAVVVVILIAMVIGGFCWMYFGMMADVAEAQDDFLQLQEAALDRMDKGEASEYGPEVIERYEKAAARR